MRPVSGFERPALQWLFVAIGAALAVLVAAEAIAIRRGRAQIEAARVAEMNARLDRQQAVTELARERRASETLALESSRLRGQAAQPGAAPPTLTLSVASRGSAPPPASVEELDATQVIELRLVLPGRAGRAGGPYAIALRRWTTGESLWTRGGLQPAVAHGAPAVTALITGDLLVAGAYEILLTRQPGGQPPEDVASYELSVAPKTR